MKLLTMKLFMNMVEAWFKQKFDKKIKVNINHTLMRIDIIKRRRNAMEKFLRSDIAELLRIGHYSDAYTRVGRLYLDEKRTLCYDFVALFCAFISDHLATMNDQSECPDECKEAVASLIYAAARFSNLPELRELRTLFSQKYNGDSLESFINKEFIGLLNRDRLPTKEMKILLMQEIAQEHGVDWDPRSLDDVSYKPSPSPSPSPSLRDHKNGWMINIQEPMNNDTDESRKTDESNGNDLVKQTETVRQRILNYWARASNLHSSSQETSSASSGEISSITSDDSSSFDAPTEIIHTPKDDERKDKDNKENEDVLNQPKVEKWGNKWWRKGGGAVEESKGGDRRVTGHVHPKLPDYDEVVARLANS